VAKDFYAGNNNCLADGHTTRFVAVRYLRASQRSWAWQNQYIMACVAQLIVEIFIFKSVCILSGCIG
jgi:hypothetical protein